MTPEKKYCFKILLGFLEDDLLFMRCGEKRKELCDRERDREIFILGHE